jgi:hypothetical protein
MERLRDAVVRVKDGEWLCRVPVVFVWSNGPSLALTPGVVYRKGVRYQSVDIAEMLDDWLATDRLPSNVSIHQDPQEVSHAADWGRMKDRRRVLIAAQPAAWQMLQTILNGEADLHPAHTMADAFTILERDRIDLIVSTIAFDESHMIEFLQAVKRTASASRIPFLCMRVLPGVVRDNLIASMRDACKACGAVDLVDIARLPPDTAQDVMRKAVEPYLQ